jgi:hypothetical protein
MDPKAPPETYSGVFKMETQPHRICSRPLGCKICNHIQTPAATSFPLPLLFSKIFENMALLYRALRLL